MNDSYKVFFGLFLKDRSRDKIEKILRENNILLELDKNLHLTVLLDTSTYIAKDIDKKYSDEFRNSSIITTDIEIQNYFNESNEKEFKKMVKEYKKIQSLTRTKAIKKITELKKDINNLKSDIMISK